jgi:hypothetical protein
VRKKRKVLKHITEPPVLWPQSPSGGAVEEKQIIKSYHALVRFDKPGTYQIWARNTYPTDAKSNVVAVTVGKGLAK